VGLKKLREVKEKQEQLQLQAELENMDMKPARKFWEAEEEEDWMCIWDKTPRQSYGGHATDFTLRGFLARYQEKNSASREKEEVISSFPQAPCRPVTHP
jgi:hypothetical protein